MSVNVTLVTFKASFALLAGTMVVLETDYSALDSHTNQI